MESRVSSANGTSTDGLKATLTAKQHYFQALIYGDETVDMNALRAACATGIPEGRGLRAITWKLLLHLLPNKRARWKETLNGRRQEYRSFCEEFIVDPKSAENGYDLNPLKTSLSSAERTEAVQVALMRSKSEMSDVTEKDHPLALDNRSKWNAYFKDNETREQIDRDVMRTHPHMDFFSGDSPSSEIHREEIKRALFVFTKLNPGITYVQGMNEIYAPLYFVFKTNEHGEYGELGGYGSTDYAEADAFFCFVDLMGDFRDNFCKQLDNSATGVKATIQRLSQALKKVDSDLWMHLTHTTQVDHHYFAFRWITLLLTQEFQFPDVLRLWDTLSAAPPNARLNLLLRVCLAMLVSVKEELLEGDYTQNLKLLQRFPSCDMNDLLMNAIRIGKEFSDI